MDLPLKRLSKRVTLPLALLLGAATSFFVVIAGAPSAHADSSTSCGQAVCYVDSTVRGESNWSSEPYTNSDGSTNPGTSSSGGGSGGSGGGPKSISKYTACNSWLPLGGGQSTNTYPWERSSSYECNFADGGAVTGSGGAVWYRCPPRGDRASNGRITYYIERVYPNGNTQWVYARYKCLYPTDADAPIWREVGRFKIYTAGQADFFQTMSSTQATQASRNGTLTSSSGYIDRGVNLANPEAYAGAWQPSFRAKTGSTSAGPLYGYYRLLWVLDYRTCVKTSLPAWLGQPPRYDCAGRGKDTFVNPYTYACNQTPPLQPGIRPGALFRASDCVPGWQCVLTGDELVGGQPARLTVMRNGEQNPTKSATPSVRIIDTGRIRNTDRWDTYRSVVAGSTPGVANVKSSWTWDRWENYKPDGWVGFHWASTDASSPFAWTTRLRFTGDYLVPKQDEVDGSISYVWVANTNECLTDLSPDVLAVRAVNK